MNTIEKVKADQGIGNPIGVLDAIRDRRAIRHYTSQKVEEKVLKNILEYAVLAPSAVNSQPWSFVVVQDPVLLKGISEDAKKGLAKDPRWKSEVTKGSGRFLDPEFDIFYGASTLIIVCSAKEGSVPEADCYLACQNLMLAAYGLGLGTCPIGLAWDVLRKGPMEARLGIPKGTYPVLPIVVGYPAEGTARTPRNPPRILNWIKP